MPRWGGDMSTPISGTTTSAVRLPTAGMDNSWVAGSSKGLIRRQPPGPGPVGDRLVKLVDVIQVHAGQEGVVGSKRPSRACRSSGILGRIRVRAISASINRRSQRGVHGNSVRTAR